MNVVAWVIRTMGVLFALFPRRRRIAMLSRQSADPFDFRLLAPHLRRAFPRHGIVRCCVHRGGHLGLGTMLRQLWLSSTSELCIVDGYVPAASIPRATERAAASLPPCVQIWHAMGAIKRFGYQSVGTPAGRPVRTAQALAMHRGYARIVAGLDGARPAFAEAFGYDMSRIVPLGLPRADYLTGAEYGDLRRRRRASAVRHLGLAGEDRPAGMVLYAPTFRKNPADPHWRERAVAALRRALPADMLLVVSGHPLDHEASGEGSAPDSGGVRYLHDASTMDVLRDADYVVTDYSSVVFEAALVRRKVMFYVPDIEDYRLSPGLNVDPERDLPTVTFRNADDLGRCIDDDRRNGSYDSAAFDSYMDGYGVGALRDAPGGSCERIAGLVGTLLTASAKAADGSGKKGNRRP